MKYSNKQYTEALWQALSGKSSTKQKEIIKAFVKLLSRSGDFCRLPLIVQKLEKKYRADQDISKVNIEYPDKTIPAIKKQIKNILGKKIIWEEKTNPALFAGVKIVINDEILVDATAKRQLDQMMHLTTNTTEHDKPN